MRHNLTERFIYLGLALVIGIMLLGACGCAAPGLTVTPIPVPSTDTPSQAKLHTDVTTATLGADDAAAVFAIAAVAIPQAAPFVPAVNAATAAKESAYPVVIHDIDADASLTENSTEVAALLSQIQVIENAIAAAEAKNPTAFATAIAKQPANKQASFRAAIDRANKRAVSRR